MESIYRKGKETNVGTNYIVLTVCYIFGWSTDVSAFQLMVFSGSCFNNKVHEELFYEPHKEEPNNIFPQLKITSFRKLIYRKVQKTTSTEFWNSQAKVQMKYWYPMECIPSVIRRQAIVSEDNESKDSNGCCRWCQIYRNKTFWSTGDSALFQRVTFLEPGSLRRADSGRNSHI